MRVEDVVDARTSGQRERAVLELLMSFWRVSGVLRREWGACVWCLGVSALGALLACVVVWCLCDLRARHTRRPAGYKNYSGPRSDFFAPFRVRGQAQTALNGARHAAQKWQNKTQII
jgi:hypothetical protein